MPPSAMLPALARGALISCIILYITHLVAPEEGESWGWRWLRTARMHPIALPLSLALLYQGLVGVHPDPSETSNSGEGAL